MIDEVTLNNDFVLFMQIIKFENQVMLIILLRQVVQRFCIFFSEFFDVFIELLYQIISNVFVILIRLDTICEENIQYCLVTDMNVENGFVFLFTNNLSLIEVKDDLYFE